MFSCYHWMHQALWICLFAETFFSPGVIAFSTSHWLNVGITVIQLTQSSCKHGLSSRFELARFDLLVNRLCELEFQHDFIQR